MFRLPVCVRLLIVFSTLRIRTYFNSSRGQDVLLSDVDLDDELTYTFLNRNSCRIKRSDILLVHMQMNQAGNTFSHCIYV